MRKNQPSAPTTKRWMAGVVLPAFCFSLLPFSPVWAQETVTAHTIVTVVAKSNEQAAAVPRESITVLEDGRHRDISGWVPLRGSRAGLQLVLLIDDSSRSSLSLQFNDFKKFIDGLPPSVNVAVGYMRNGAANLVQGFTTDHAAAANALRLPSGVPGGNGSPYFCLSDLAKHWPEYDANMRREVIMVTDGIDRYSGRRYDPENPYVQAAIRDSQRAGVIVYSIYYRGAGGLDRSGFATDGGQNYLVQLSQATGGQAYYQGFGNPVTVAPFLSDIQRKLENQYELSFISAPAKGLRPIKVKCSEPNTKLAWPAQIPVGGTAVRE